MSNRISLVLQRAQFLQVAESSVLTHRRMPPPACFHGAWSNICRPLLAGRATLVLQRCDPEANTRRSRLDDQPRETQVLHPRKRVARTPVASSNFEFLCCEFSGFRRVSVILLALLFEQGRQCRVCGGEAQGGTGSGLAVDRFFGGTP